MLQAEVTLKSSSDRGHCAIAVGIVLDDQLPSYTWGVQQAEKSEIALKVFMP
ncbi:MAG TPA: hypothetical protein V6D50_10725 [Chroococcales cyanobacterium]